MPGATIYIDSLQIGAITNNYGFYTFSVPTGKHLLSSSYIGFSPLNKELEINNNITVQITLSPEASILNEVVIKASVYGKESKKTQVSAIVISLSQVENMPALLGQADVIKTLQLLPGIQSGGEGSAQIYVRGGSPDQNLTILDDATVYNSNHLFGFLSVYNTDAVQSIKTYKGDFPTAYGGRLSNITDITMKDGNKEKLSGKLNVGLLSSSFMLEGPIVNKQTSFLVTGRRTFADLIARPFQANNDNKANLYFYDMNLKMHHILNDRNNIYVSTFLGQDAFKTTVEKAQNNTEETLKSGNITATARWNHQYSSQLFSNVSLVYSNYNLNATYNQNTGDESYSFNAFSRIDDIGLKADFEYPTVSNHRINFGGSSTLHHFTPERKNLAQPQGTSRNEQVFNSIESAVYGEGLFTLLQRLKTKIGLRATHFSISGLDNFRIEPRLSLNYQFDNLYTLKGSYTAMNQFVHLLSSTGSGLPTDLWVSSTAQVPGQQTQQGVLGLVKDFANTEYAMTLEGYYKTLDNVIAYKEGASFIDVQNLQTGQNVSWEENITSGKGLAYGAELLLRKQKGPLQGWIGYTLSWSERKFDEINGGRRFFSKYDQRHNISIMGTYKPNNRITWSASWVYRTGTNFTIANQTGLSAGDDFPIGEGRTNFVSNTLTTFATTRNNVRGEAVHRLNLGVQFHRETKCGYKRSWGPSIYNVYARRNPFFYYVSDGMSAGFGIGNNDTNVPRSLRRVAPLVFIPSINYSLKF